MFAGADTFAAFLHGAGTDPFEAKGAVFAAAFADEGEGGTVNRADRSTVFVKLSIRSFGVSGVERDTGAFETESGESDFLTTVSGYLALKSSSKNAM